MDIEAIVKKHFARWVTDTEFGNVEVHLRAALTEAEGAMAMEHNLKMLQVEATMQNLVERILQLEAALEIIAGHKQCMDNTMSNAEVAMAALAAAIEGEKK